MSEVMIRYYSVEISDGTGVIASTNEFRSTEIPVLAENDKYLVIDDRSYTTVDKDPSKYCAHAPMSVPSISLHTSDSVWGNRVRYSLYTFKKVKASTIRKEIEAAILKKFGFFMSGIDLSVIADKKP